MKNYRLILSIGIALFLLSSCTQRLVDFTIISTKNLDLSAAGNFKRNNFRTEGEDVSHIIFIIPLGIPNMKEAIDRAIEKVPGAVALVDGVVYSKSWSIILYGQNSYVVEGTPLIDPKLAENTQIPEYMYIELDKKGEIKMQSEVTEVEYKALQSKYIKPLYPSSL